MIDFLIGVTVFILAIVLIIAAAFGVVWLLSLIPITWVMPILFGSFMVFWIWSERKSIYRSMSELGREVRRK